MLIQVEILFNELGYFKTNQIVTIITDYHFSSHIYSLVLGYSLAFFYLLVPGYVSASAFGLYTRCFGKKIVLSVGLSISLLALLGLLVNTILSFIGISNPLLPTYVHVTVASLILSLCSVHLFRGEKNIKDVTSSRKIGIDALCKTLTLVILPIFSVVGIILMNSFGQNFVVLFMLFLTFLVILILALRNLDQKWIYPFSIFIISASLQLMVGLTSPHLMGWDIHGEYYVYKSTSLKSRWDASQFTGNIYYLCLSDTLLPTMLERLTGVEGELIYKSIYPLIFSLIPVSLFYLCKDTLQFKDKKSFVCSLFFISHLVFLTLHSIAKSGIALFFFSLSILLLFEKTKKPSYRLCFIIFTVLVVVSHYVTAIVYGGLVTITWFIHAIKRGVKASYGRVLMMSTPFLITTLTLFWYGQISEAPTYHFLDYVTNVVSSLSSAFLREMRAPVVYEAAGLGTYTLWLDRLRWVFLSTNRIFLMLGSLSIGLNITKKNFKKEISILNLLCLIFLAVFILLPWATLGYNLERLYVQFLVVMSPAFVVGAEVALHTLPHHLGAVFTKSFRTFVLPKETIYKVLVFLTVAQLIFISGIGDFVAGFPKVVWLSKNSEVYWSTYVTDQEVHSVRWISRYTGSTVFADIQGQLRLESYGNLPRGINNFNFITDFIGDGLLYLRQQNHLKGKVVTPGCRIENLTKFLNIDRRNKLYSDGATAVYYLGC